MASDSAGTTDDTLDVPNPSLADATQAEALNNDFIKRQQRLLYTDPDAFYRQQGEDALAATPGVLDRLQDLRQEMLDAAPTPGVRQRLASALDGHMTFTRDNVLRHTRREARAYQAATAQNRIDLLGKQAALDFDDPASVAVYAQAADGAGREHALATDTDPDMRAAAAASSIWRNAIESALSRNDAATADMLHANAGDALAPGDAAAIALQMAAARERLNGQTYVAGLALPAPDPAGPLDAEPALAAIDAAHQAATAQNAQAYAGDPSQQATNQHFIDVRFGIAKHDVVQSKADLDAKVADWLNQPGQTQRPPLALWTRMLPDARGAADVVLAQNALPTMGSMTPMTPARYQRGGADIGGIPLPNAEVPISPDLTPRPLRPDQEDPKSEEFVGYPVILPDGSRIPNPFVEDRRNVLGYVTAPSYQLPQVAAAGRKYREEADWMKTQTGDMKTAALQDFLWHMFEAVGTGGIYDTQREGEQFRGIISGKLHLESGQFKQLRAFRPIANINVGLFCQQAGLSFEDTMFYASMYASMFSDNGFDKQTEYFIKEGYKIGQSGMFDEPKSR